MRSGDYLSDYEQVTPSHQQFGRDSGRAEAVELATDDAPYTPRATERLPPQESVGLVSAGPEKVALKRGHGLSYVGLFLFTAVLYFRPYELIPALSALTSMAFWIAVATLLVFIPAQLSLENTLTYRPREVNLALLLCLAGLLSLPLATDRMVAWDAFVDYLKVIMMFIVMLNVVRTERRLKGLFFLVLVVSSLLSVWALADYQAGRVSVGTGRIVGRIGGLFGNPNDLALHLVTIVPLAVVLALSTRGVLRRLLYGACALLMIAGIIVTYSRGGFLGLSCAALVLLWKIGRRHRFLSVVAVAFMAIGLLALLPGSFSARIGALAQGDLDASAVSRRNLLIQSLMTIAYNPLLGVGMSNFHIISVNVSESHNSFTQVGAELGLPALIIYTLFVLSPFKRLRRIERAAHAEPRKSRFYYLAVGLQASLAGYLCSSLFASVAYHYYVYYLIGYVVCLSRMFEAGQSADSVTPPATTAA